MEGTGMKLFQLKFQPQQRVRILMFECPGRIARCILDGGPQPIYAVDYAMNGEHKRAEFYEDEIE
jgi:hypothetical protein